MLPTIEEALAYMGIDYADEVVTVNANRALKAAVAHLHGAVGADVEKYLPDDARVTELVLTYTDDFYSERGVSAKLSNATRRLVANTELQLRLELRRAKEEASKV
jgi:hypothetical protein